MNDLSTRLQEELKALDARLEAAHKELQEAQRASTTAHNEVAVEASRIAAREATMRAGPNFTPESNAKPLLVEEYEARKAEIRQDLARGYGDGKGLADKVAAADKALAEQRDLVKGLGESKQRLLGEIAVEQARESAERTAHLQLAMKAYGDRKAAADPARADRLADFPPMPAPPEKPTPEQERLAELKRQQQQGLSR